IALELGFIPVAAWLWTKPLVGAIVVVIKKIAAPIAPICVVICLRRIALLGRQKKLARSSTTLIAALLLAACLGLLGAIASSYSWIVFGNVPSGSFMVGLVKNAYIGASFVDLICFVMGIFLLDGYRRMLSEAIATAKQRAAA